MHVQAGRTGTVKSGHYFLGNYGAFSNTTYHYPAPALAYLLYSFYKLCIYGMVQGCYTFGFEAYSALCRSNNFFNIHCLQNYAIWQPIAPQSCFSFFLEILSTFFPYFRFPFQKTACKFFEDVESRAKFFLLKLNPKGILFI
jgi:hypothetical protein